MRLRRFTLKRPKTCYEEVALLWETVQRSLKPMPAGMQTFDGQVFTLVYDTDLRRCRPSDLFHTEGRMH